MDDGGRTTDDERRMKGAKQQILRFAQDDNAVSRIPRPATRND